MKKLERRKIDDIQTARPANRDLFGTEKEIVVSVVSSSMKPPTTFRTMSGLDSGLSSAIIPRPLVISFRRCVLPDLIADSNSLSTKHQKQLPRAAARAFFPNNT